MIVRIRLQRGPSVRRNRRKNQNVSLALATLLSPIMLATCALGLWRLASDLGVAGQFAIQDGLFSHWQVWMGIGGVLQLLAMALNRYGNSAVALTDAEIETGRNDSEFGILIPNSASPSYKSANSR